MSRIDQALRIREGATGAPRSETTVFEPANSSLAHYPNESALRPEPEPYAPAFDPLRAERCRGGGVAFEQLVPDHTDRVNVVG